MKKSNTEEREDINTTENEVKAAEMGEKPDNIEELADEVEGTQSNKNEEPKAELPSEEESLRDELAESKDKYLRLYSEFENFRRRTAKEKLGLVQTANEELMTALIPVLDDFERAEKSFAEKEVDVKAVKEGFDLIHTKFRKILEQKGLGSMDTKEGSEFDSELHEAITQIPAPKKGLKGKVVDVIEKGYLLKEKVIRYAKVVIGS